MKSWESKLLDSLGMGKLIKYAFIALTLLGLTTVVSGLIYFTAPQLFLAQAVESRPLNVDSLTVRVQRVPSPAEILAELAKPDVEPGKIRVYTENNLFAGRRLEIVSSSGKSESALPSLAERGDHAVTLLPSPGRMRQGWTLRAISARDTIEFHGVHTGNAEIMSIRLLVDDTCGDILPPALQVDNSGQPFVYPTGIGCQLQ